MGLPVKHTELEWSLLFQRGEEKALAFFFNELHATLALFAFQYVKNRETAEEIASDAFVKTWKHHEKLDSFGAIRAYLYKVVYNGAMQCLHREKRKKAIEKETATPETDNYTPFESTVRAETYRQLHAAIKNLSPGKQQVIKMYFLEGKTSGEIARELKLSPSTVKDHKSKALAKLRKGLALFVSLLPV